MSDPSRPISRWSTSMSITTKSTAYTNQTIPLTNVRRKLLFRNSPAHQKTYAQRMAKSKHNIEELFKLYYSNDIKFDTIHRQIVTGTRIPTAQTTPVPQSNLNCGSTNAFDSKHCVSREQLTPSTDLDVEKTPQTKTIKSAPIKRTVQIRTENNSTTYSPALKSFPSKTVTPVIPNPPLTTPSTQQEELSDSVLVKSVTFADEISNETPTEDNNTNKEKPNETSRPKSSLLTMPPAPPPPSLLSMNQNTHRKDTTALSHVSSSTTTSVHPQQNNPPAVVTGSAVIVRQRSPIKSSRSRQRPKSGATTATTTTNLSLPQTATKPSTPSISSPLPIQPEAPELPVYLGTQRVVSIPSRCSRYVLVTFPEVPLRYNAPSYVERLLLPERFPTLFQNIVHSYDRHLSSTSIPSHRSDK